MVVAPYNAQANNIRERLKKKNDDVRVGTIDLFQGQEAKVVLISMTTSDVESLPRHKDFFFSRNRLNVAISRAECVAIIIFNENLLLASTNSIKEMKLMNSFCKLLESHLVRKKITLGLAISRYPTPTTKLRPQRRYKQS